MSKRIKFLAKIKNISANIKFDELVNFLKNDQGLTMRINGSHHVFYTGIPNGGLNLQKTKGNKVKREQLRQVKSYLESKGVI